MRAAARPRTQPRELRRVEFVGPQVGKELAENGALALLVTAVGIVLYLGLRFEWSFGVAAIIANLHDVVIILGFFALLPVGVLAAGAGRGAGGPRLLGERVGGGVRPDARELPQDAQGHACPRSSTTPSPRTMSRTIITHGCTQMMVHLDADLRRRDAALLRAGAHHRHPVRHLLLGAGGEPARDVAGRRTAASSSGRRRSTRQGQHEGAVV